MPFPVDNIRAACAAQNTTLAQLERELKIGNGVIARWEKAKGSPPYDRLVAIAERLNTTVEQLSSTQKEKAPAESGERDIKAAFFDGMGLTEDEQDDLWQDAKEYFQFKIAQRKRKDGNR